ncbi:MAG: hypothetical protein JXB48_09115 [Candidatus Latescibacteria bacterium]|nr:hypothetical protein [Candidatus Latescibacterota bacterium]
MKLETVLTVAQSKRLIARGVRNHPVVKTAMNNGTIGVCRGTTTSYVAEEFLGYQIERFAYTLGLTLPKNPQPKIEKPSGVTHDLIIRQGKIHMDGETVVEAAKNMQAGDVIIKGANALNYTKKIAGCLIGHPAGGTAGGLWGPLYGMKIRFIIPVGLEKEIVSDINEISSFCMDENPGNSLMPMTGIIITEIEAIKILSGATAVQIAAGGIRGAEGSVRLLISGKPDEINTIKSILNDIGDEYPY